jgi:hypothetical protein
VCRLRVVEQGLRQALLRLLQSAQTVMMLLLRINGWCNQTRFFFLVCAHRVVGKGGRKRKRNKGQKDLFTW